MPSSAGRGRCCGTDRVDRRSRLWLVVVLVAATAGRLWLAAALPLVDDEAYYWAWAQRLAWGYPDHPPAIAALIRLSTGLLGDTPLGVRFGAVVLSLGIALLLFDLGRMLFGPRVGVVAAIAYHTIPTFALGGIFAFPDAPFMFFWTLALWALWRAHTRGHPLDWYLAGLAAGLAAMSKLTAAFLAVSMVGFLIAVPAGRRWWARGEPYRAAALALLVTLPMLSWNAHHGWITFYRAREPIPWIGTGVPALNAAAFLLAQLAYYGPLAALLLAALGAVLLTRRRDDPRYAFLLWGALPILGLTWAASFDGIPKPHWHAAGFLVALVAAAAFWPALRDRQGWRLTAGIATVLNLTVIAVLVVLPFRSDTPTAGQIWGWDQVAAGLDPLVRSTPSSPGRFILTSDYQTAGQLEFQLRRRYVVATPYGGDAYGEWVSRQWLIDQNGVYVNDLPSGPGVPLHRMFRQVDPLPPIDVLLTGRVVRRFFVYRGLGFRGLPHARVHPQ